MPRNMPRGVAPPICENKKFISPLDYYKQNDYIGKVIVLITERGETMAVLADKAVIGERLRSLRGSRSQKEVADALGVTVMAVSLYEAGERMPRDEIKVKLANYFKKSVTSIFYA